MKQRACFPALCITAMASASRRQAISEARLLLLPRTHVSLLTLRDWAPTGRPWLRLRSKSAPQLFAGERVRLQSDERRNAPDSKGG